MSENETNEQQAVELENNDENTALKQSKTKIHKLMVEMTSELNLLAIYAGIEGNGVNIEVKMPEKLKEVYDATDFDAAFKSKMVILSGEKVNGATSNTDVQGLVSTINVTGDTDK